MELSKQQQQLLLPLARYTPWDAGEAAFVQRTQTFITEHTDCLLRSQLAGHWTASAWVIDPATEQVLLIHHRKLDRWFQPGGHADGNPDLSAVAKTEVQEETGLAHLQLAQDSLFDLDVHLIPERKGIPAHFHYDHRYLFHADSSQPLNHNHEAKAVNWVPLTQVAQYNDDRSLIRLVEKMLKK